MSVRTAVYVGELTSAARHAADDAEGAWRVETFAVARKYAHLGQSHLAQRANAVTLGARSIEQKAKTPLSEAA